MKTKKKIIMALSAFLIGISTMNSYSQIKPAVNFDSTQIQEKLKTNQGEEESGQKQNQEKQSIEQQAKSKEGNVKQVRNARPDMTKARGARPPEIIRPNAAPPKGMGKPGGAMPRRGR